MRRWLAALLVLAACTADDSSTVRGRGMTVAPLSPAEQAHVYEAAARAAFDVDNPALSLMVDARLLPQAKGLSPSGSLTDAVVAELRRRGAVKGTCEPPLQGIRGTAQCKSSLPGYVLRFSPVFSLGVDSTQVYLYAQKYDTPSSGISETLRFERAYQVVRRDDGWKAVREGQVPREVRGEKK
ncbi:MAG: hypothetical protein ABI442_03880 [Gemmatimonadaceae bacterium]